MNLRPGPGIYDTLLDQTLADLLSRYPELRTVFEKLESEEQPARYAEFVSKVLKQPFHRFPHGTPAGTCELLEDMQSADAVDILVFARDLKRSAVT
jgi:hypothetical protein